MPPRVEFPGIRLHEGPTVQDCGKKKEGGPEGYSRRLNCQVRSDPGGAVLLESTIRHSRSSDSSSGIGFPSTSFNSTPSLAARVGAKSRMETFCSRRPVCT